MLPLLRISVSLDDFATNQDQICTIIVFHYKTYLNLEILSNLLYTNYVLQLLASKTTSVIM